MWTHASKYIVGQEQIILDLGLFSLFLHLDGLLGFAYMFNAVLCKHSGKYHNGRKNKQTIRKWYI